MSLWQVCQFHAEFHARSLSQLAAHAETADVATHVARTAPAAQLPKHAGHCPSAHRLMKDGAPCDCACSFMLQSVSMLQNNKSISELCYKKSDKVTSARSSTLRISSHVMTPLPQTMPYGSHHRSEGLNLLLPKKLYSNCKKNFPAYSIGLSHYFVHYICITYILKGVVNPHFFFK